MARFDCSEDFNVHNSYIVTGKSKSLASADEFIEGWYDSNPFWIYDHPNDMCDFILDLAEHLNLNSDEVKKKCPHRYAWMSYYSVDKETNTMEIETEGFLKGQTDPITFLCEAYGLTYKCEEWDDHEP